MACIVCTFLDEYRSTTVALQKEESYQKTLNNKEQCNIITVWEQIFS